MEFDFNTYTTEYINPLEIKKYSKKISHIKKKFETNIKELEWFRMNEYVDNMELKEIKDIALKLKATTDVLLVIGIGGSYIGSKAIINALKGYFNEDYPEIIYVGNSLSSMYYNDLIRYLKDKRLSINVISKSGSTMETIITFNLLMNLMRQRYEIEELRRRVFVTTNIHGGNLLDIARENGFRTFFIPDNISGRYSLLTPVTLFPMAVSGVDIISFLKGAKEGRMYLNYASIYAMVRTILFESGKVVEAFSVYEPKLVAYTEWLKQLFAESVGKDLKGTLPINMINPRDLHSLGQFISEGNPIIFETVIRLAKVPEDVFVDKYQENLTTINDIVIEKVCLAHSISGCPTNLITISDLSEYNLGEASMFFMMSAAISAYLIDVNPFNQPGVNQYKELIAQEMRVL